MTDPIQKAMLNFETWKQPTLPTITIVMTPDGKNVDVTGPLADKELCWRMLTDAAALILKFRLHASPDDGCRTVLNLDVMQRQK